MKEISIEDFLSVGRENPKTSKELASLLNTTPREIRRLIQAARLRNVPICASCVGNPGYYIARDKKDMSGYIQKLQKMRDVYSETILGCIGSVELLPD